MFLAGRIKILSKFVKYKFDHISFSKPVSMNGIMGQVGDASGYMIDCFINCDSTRVLKQFVNVGREFVFIGGTTVVKGKIFVH